MQGNQVIKKVVGTRYNPVLTNRPVENRSKEGTGRLSVSIGFITVDRFEEDSDEEEYKYPEGYRQVSIVSITEVDRVQVEKEKGRKKEG